MLKLNLRANTQTSKNKIKFESFGLTSDSNFITGLCDSSYELNINNKVEIFTPSTPQGFITNIKTEIISVWGYVVLPTVYTIQEDTQSNAKSLLYKDNYYYYNKSWDENNIYIGENKYLIENQTITIDEKYYLTNDELILPNGITYNIFISNQIVITDENNNEITPKEAVLFDFPKDFIKFYIPLDVNKKLDVEYASSCDRYKYVEYQGERYIVKSKGEKEFVYISDEISGETKFYKVSEDNELIEITEEESQTEAMNLEGGLLTLNDNDKTVLQVDTVFQENEHGSSIYLYLGDNNVELTNNDIIIAKCTSNEERYIILENGTVFYNGKTYTKSATTEDGFNYSFVVIGNEEYRLYYENDTRGYIIYGEDKIYFTINGTTVSREALYQAKTKYVSGSSSTDFNITLTEYPLRNYEYVNIEEELYTVVVSSKVDEDGYLQESEYITISQPISYRLGVSEIEGINKIRCKPIIEGVWSNDLDGLDLINDETEEDGSYRSIVFDIATNITDFIFEIENHVYGKKVVLDYNNFYDSSDYFTINENNIEIYHLQDYLVMPLLTKQVVGINLQQEDLLNKLFIADSENSAINSIVDMDKDVYYPYYKINNKYQAIDKITFDLHFRTRDLETWNINEDYSLINSTKKEKDINNIQDVYTSKTNWFCMDYYQENELQNSCLHSDIVGLLGFSNSDIFYQKNKVKKSFMRLLFYDSPNPNKQSLLYQATVWLDSNNLYRKYINGKENEHQTDIVYGINDLSMIFTTSEPITSTTKGVEKTFDEEHRLSSQFIITNRYNNVESAEGFCLYLFKDLTEGICHKTIYMKVMFNHAGYGQSSLFTLPLDTDGNCIKDFSIKKNIETLKQGVSLSQITDAIYIPIDIYFDKDKQTYMYIIDEQYATINDGIANFNLFEIKVKDESN